MSAHSSDPLSGHDDPASSNWLSQKWSNFTSTCSSAYNTLKSNTLAPYIAWSIAKPALVSASDYIGGSTWRNTAVGLATASDIGWAINRLGPAPSYEMAMNVPLSVGVAAAATTTAAGTLVLGSMGYDPTTSYCALSGATDALALGGTGCLWGGVMGRWTCCHL
jgi:hypothetical protein